MTPLHVAASHGSIGIATELLNNKADIRAQDEQQNTPLHYAAQVQFENFGGFSIQLFAT